MVKRIGFSIPRVYNSRDLVNELDELAGLKPDEVIASQNEKAAVGIGQECEIRERDNDDTIVVLQALDEERIQRILKAAGIEQEA